MTGSCSNATINTYAPVPRTRQVMDKNTCDKAIRLKADIRHLQKRQQQNFMSTNFDGQYIIAKHIIFVLHGIKA